MSLIKDSCGQILRLTFSKLQKYQHYPENIHKLKIKKKLDYHVWRPQMK